MGMVPRGEGQSKPRAGPGQSCSWLRRKAVHEIRAAGFDHRGGSSRNHLRGRVGSRRAGFSRPAITSLAGLRYPWKRADNSRRMRLGARIEKSHWSRGKVDTCRGRNPELLITFDDKELQAGARAILVCLAGQRRPVRGFPDGEIGRSSERAVEQARGRSTSRRKENGLSPGKIYRRCPRQPISIVRKA